ncbi:MAG: peptidase M15 [Leptolyngbyaceae cyanobacterium SM1_1_3]|nr:peptidase M15 [Leptolyngbyaceae cyanobacterium SM1_1_3]NJN04014.1 peptidase M15 [Leptolyngbyaceae cyanobacterium RM1_1_2]NJO09761.1 peptidase M15 [Leptolyngbyaceae cyanobacterium SL_1_1]
MDLRLETLQPEYEKAFAACRLRSEAEPEVKRIGDRLVELRSHYEVVEQKTGIPWWFAGLIHFHDWNLREPALFEQKAVEVLMAKRYHKARNRTLGAYLWGLDLWNGFRDGAGGSSAWIWAGTSALEKDASQVGAAALLVYLQGRGVVDMPKPEQGKRLIVLADTLFKVQPEQSFKLQSEDKLSVHQGTRLEILEDEPSKLGHMKVKLPDGVLLGQNNRSDWYIFSGHVQVEGTEPDNKPQDLPAEPVAKIADPDPGPAITVPKLGTVYLGKPILDGGHFSWAEATKNGSRIPADAAVVDGILKIAGVMEEVREYLGDRPITINSWYRDPASNRRVGGASKSRHISGDAVDFVVAGIAPPQVNRQLEAWWNSRGGLASANSFTHIDARGYKARWRY